MPGRPLCARDTNKEERLDNTMENVTIIEHPLVQHKISMLRDKRTGTNEFRTLIEEIATLMGYEALRDLPLEEVEVETPIETCMTPVIAGKKLAVVPILRAGLGMVNGILALVPTAKVGHIGLCRIRSTKTGRYRFQPVIPLRSFRSRKNAPCKRNRHENQRNISRKKSFICFGAFISGSIYRLST